MEGCCEDRNCLRPNESFNFFPKKGSDLFHPLLSHEDVVLGEEIYFTVEMCFSFSLSLSLSLCLLKE